MSFLLTVWVVYPAFLVTHFDSARVFLKQNEDTNGLEIIYSIEDDGVSS